MAVYQDDSVKGSPSHHSIESRSGEFAGCGGRVCSLFFFVRCRIYSSINFKLSFNLNFLF